MLLDIGFILAGLAVLIVGANLLVKGASQLALALGIAPLVVGLTVVAFGTGAPELAVGIQSSLANKTGLLLGNAVGSNIYNVLFILGVCAIVTPLAVAPQIIRFDIPILIGAGLTLWLMARTSTSSAHRSDPSRCRTPSVRRATCFTRASWSIFRSTWGRYLGCFERLIGSDDVLPPASRPQKWHASVKLVDFDILVPLRPTRG